MRVVYVLWNVVMDPYVLPVLLLLEVLLFVSLTLFVL